MNKRDIFIVYAYAYNNDWNSIYSALKGDENVLPTYTFEEAVNCVPFGDKIFAIVDSDYPKRIKERLPRPPFVIYYKGNLSALRKYDYTYLLGSNSYNLPKEDLITYDSSNYVLDFGGELQMFCNNTIQVARIGLAYCKQVAVTKVLLPNDYENLLITEALTTNTLVLVNPTLSPSLNNNLIKDGAMLLDSKEDL